MAEAAATGPFRPRTVLWLVVVGGLSLLSAVFWGIFGADVAGVGSAQADSFSRSALGHHALVRLLHELEIPVVVSRFDSGHRARGSAVLVLAEPQLDDTATRDADALRRAVGAADLVLLVLPKWRGTEDPERPGWIDAVSLLLVEEVGELLDLFDLEDAQVVRPAATTDWRTELVADAPSLAAPQLLRADHVAGLVHCREGILFGRVETHLGALYVLSDPDVLANHGLGRGLNAELAVRMLDVARSGERTVVIDETFHGHVQEPSVHRALFDFPLLLATLQALFTLLVLLWSGMGRFGAPAPAEVAIQPGKAFLIDNIASLLRYGGHSVDVLKRYLKAVQHEVGQRLHLPARLDAEAARAWLERYGEQRRVTVGLERLRNEVGRASRERVLPLAERIYRWREEMIHGPGSRT
ncbi:MAG: DUF4350 domain-containing protein [Planctomycetota bacterium]